MAEEDEGSAPWVISPVSGVCQDRGSSGLAGGRLGIAWDPMPPSPTPSSDCCHWTLGREADLIV